MIDLVFYHIFHNFQVRRSITWPFHFLRSRNPSNVTLKIMIVVIILQMVFYMQLNYELVKGLLELADLNFNTLSRGIPRLA